MGCAVTSRILEGIAAGMMQAEPAAIDLSLGSEASITLGVMFLVGSLLCRLGAEQNAAA